MISFQRAAEPFERSLCLRGRIGLIVAPFIVIANAGFLQAQLEFGCGGHLPGLIRAMGRPGIVGILLGLVFF